MPEAGGTIDEPPADDGEVDVRMADILGGDEQSISQVRQQLRGSSDRHASDLMSRLDALDFVDTICGQPGSELPERLGEYRITALLGRGGMGTVYEAFQESLERPVALKVLSPALTSDPKMRRRFRTEARASATLHHQHIVPVYGFGEAAGHLYFTMERVDGISLDRHIAGAARRGVTPDPRDVARRFAGVADALSHAHRRGVLHRDVKPGNILVHPDGTLALADFGLSKMLGEASMSVSSPGGFLGTLYYAAPEQARGTDVCPASDLYSLGVTMFETLTNELPLRGNTTEAMLEAVLRGSPRRLRAVLPKAPKDFDAVLVKLMHKDPEDRYADAEALARDLNRIADDEPVKIRRLSAFVRTWRSIRKRPALSTAIAIAAVLFIAVVWQWRVAAIARSDALVSRYRQLIAAAAVEFARDPGDPAGPPGLFETLTGVEFPHDWSARTVDELLDSAAAIAPEGTEGEPARIRAAYANDPAPPATAALREGRGLVALRRLNTRIDELEHEWGFASGDSVTPMQLYRLYAGRAVAYLTSSLHQPGMAARDLLRASLIRRGAFLPRVLSTLVEWDPEEGVERLLATLDALVQEGPEGAERTVGALLIACARIDAPSGANLMDFELEYRHRRAMHARGLQLLGDAPTRSPEPGLEVRLLEIARKAQAVGAKPKDRHDWIDSGRVLLANDVGLGSPLQAWGIVFDLVDSQGETNRGGFEPSLDPDRIGVQTAALREFLDLNPEPVVVGRLWPQVRSWLASLPPTSRDVCRLRALFLQRLEPGTSALAAADAWVRADPDDPRAYLCRMRCRIDEEPVAAANDAGIALQKAFDREAMRIEIHAALVQAESRNPEVRSIREAFEPNQ